MPSGAKKRKAAKKKKEIQSDDHVNPPLHSHDPKMTEEDDLKNQMQEDKDNDVGEVSSSTSQEHHSSHQNVVSGSEGEEIEDKESKVDQGIEGDEQISIQVEREFKIADESNTKNRTSNHDDESHDIVIDYSDSDSDSTSQKPVETIQSAPIQETSNLIGEQNPVSVSEKNQVDVEAERSLGPQSSVEDGVDRSMASTEEADKGNAQSVEQNAKTSDSCESDETLIVSYDATKASDDYVLVSEQDYAGTQPTHTALPHPARTTSWKSCCGLFELFSGSNR